MEHIERREEVASWSSNAPSVSSDIDIPLFDSDIIHVSIESIGSSRERKDIICVATASGSYTLLNLDNPYNPTILERFSFDSAMIAIIGMPYPMQSILMATADGFIRTYCCKTKTVDSERRDHADGLTCCTITSTPTPFNVIHVATTGTDEKIYMYKLPSPSMFQAPKFNAPITSLTLPTESTAICFIREPKGDKPVLLMTRRNEAAIFFYALPRLQSFGDTEAPGLRYLGSQRIPTVDQDDFRVLSVAVSPDGMSLALRVKSGGKARVVILRLVYPPMPHPEKEPEVVEENKLAAEAPIITELFNYDARAQDTIAALAKVVWRPDGTGIWANRADGGIVGIDAKSGDIVTTLTCEQEDGILGCGYGLWSGKVKLSHGIEEEWVVTGRTDRRLIIWRPTSERTE